MKVLEKILLILCILCLMAGAMAYDAFYAAPKRFTPRYETLSSEAIPAQLDDVTILFFSDLDYNRFMNKDRLEKLVKAVNNVSPDVIIFGGDLFDADTGPVSEQVLLDLTDGLKRMEAPLGKFAVLGDTDHMNDTMLDFVRRVLYDADFELLENKSIPIRNTGSQSVTLVGLDNGLNGSLSTRLAYASVSPSTYAITVCHTPDTADRVPADLTDYFLAGHSHGGQIFYGFGAYYMPEQAFNYLRGKHSVSGAFTLDITSGVGTTGQDVRFLANAEIVLYRLKHIESQTPQQPQAPQVQQPQVQQPQDTQEQQVEP